MRNRAGTPSPVSGPDQPLAQALALGDVLQPDGLERLVRARTVESTAVLPASSRPPRASAGSVRYPSRAVGLAIGAAVGLPGAPAGGHGGLVFRAVDTAGRSVGAGRCSRPYVAGIGIAPAGGHPALRSLQRRLPCAGRRQLVERGADPAAGKQPRHGFGHRGRDPGLAASGCGSVYAPGDSAEPRPGHPLHPMIAGHATGQKQRRAYSDRRPDRRRLRMGLSRSLGGAARAVLSPLSRPPERPRPHSLRGAPVSRGGSAPVV